MNNLPKMRLKASLIVEFDVDDLISAADHQRRLERVAESLRDDYPQASLVICERRNRRGDYETSARGRGRATGAMHAYLDEV